MNRLGSGLHAPLTVVLLLGAAALFFLAAPSTQAQGIYSVTGQVTDTNETPLSGAQVILSPEDEGPARETTTDEEGAYSFEQTEAGSYQVVANHDCCQPASKAVDVGGMQLEHRVDLELEPEARSSEDTLVLSGRVVDHEGDQPVADVRLTFENYYEETEGEDEDRRGHGEATEITTSGANGTYAVELRPGHVRLLAEADGYDDTSASFRIDQDRELTIPVRPASEKAAVIEGVITSDDGESLSGARVSVARDHPTRCGPEVCYAETPAEPAREEEHAEHDNVTFRFRQAASPYDDARTDEEGRYRLTTREGPVRVSAWARDHVDAEQRLNVSAGQSHEVDLILERIPPDNVLVEGTVVDQATGDPIDFSHVRVENQAWGHYNRTFADENGSFELRTKPGYTIVHLSADEYRAHVCAQPHDAPERTAQSNESHHGEDTASSTAMRTSPQPPCEPAQRETAYFPRAITFQAENDTVERLDVELAPRARTDARLEGWAINASDDQAIPDARVFLVNEQTNERGHATTDEDGSFAVDVRSGYYTVRVRAEGYFHAVDNVEIGPNQTRTVALELTPGQPRHGYVRPVAHAEDHAMAVEGDDEASARPSQEDGEAGQAGSQPAGQGIASVGDLADGPATFEGSGGDLGPYDPSRVGSTSGVGEDLPRPAPSPRLAVLVVLVSIAALLGRRQQSS